MEETTKLAIGAGVGILLVAGIAYAASSSSSSTASTTPAAIPPIGGGTTNQNATIAPIGGGTTNQTTTAAPATTAIQQLNPQGGGVQQNLLGG